MVQSSGHRQGEAGPPGSDGPAALADPAVHGPIPSPRLDARSAGGGPEGNPTIDRPSDSRTDRIKRYQLHMFAAYLVVGVALLVLLRVMISDLNFIGVGWIVVLVALPLLPWLVPRLVEFARMVSPYVQTLKVGAIQVDLRAAQRTPTSIATAGMQPSLPNDVSALSSGTGISSLVNALRDLDRQGGSPVAIIDLQDGHKWRLPNLYFLARLLELDPVVRQLIFTEMKGGVDGYLVGSAAPEYVRRRIEQAAPSYSAAAANLPRRDVPTLADPNWAQLVGGDFLTFRNFLGANSGRDDDPTFGYLTSFRLAQVAGPLSGTAVEGLEAVLEEDQLRAVVLASVQFVPVTSNGRVTGVVDRNAVALAAARSALAAR